MVDKGTSLPSSLLQVYDLPPHILFLRLRFMTFRARRSQRIPFGSELRVRAVESFGLTVARP